MATKSSFILAVLFIANPIMLLFFQNCSVAPHRQTASVNVQKTSALPDAKDILKNN